MKKYTLNHLKGRINNGKTFFLRLKEQKGDLTLNLDINFWRLDIIKNLKKEYGKETYVLTIEKYDSRFYPTNTKCLVDIREEFSSIEDILSYLEKNKFIKKEDLIEDD